MAFQFRLPDIGEGLHEAELLRWLVKVGDQVQEDQPLLEVQTDKASVEITSPVSGRVTKLIGSVGDILQVGSVVVEFDGDQAAAMPPDQEAEAAVAAAAPGGQPPKAEAVLTPPPAAPASPAAAQAPQAAAAARPGGRVLAAPATRRLAREMGIDITQVPGTGPAGRVTPEDLRRFAAGGAGVSTGPTPAAEAAPSVSAAPEAAAAPAPAGTPGAREERIPLKGIRKVIAERMVQSKRTAPHVTTVDEVDMTALAAFRSRAKELAAKKGIKLSFLPFYFKALAAALKEFPYLNASIDDEKQEIVLKKEYHIGFALDTEAGLLVPVVRDVDRKSVFQIAREMEDLIQRGRAGKLKPDELKGSTFTVSNQGSIGGLYFTPIINWPEVAILGIGKAQDRPVVREGQVVIRKMAYLALSFDHRLVDGGTATRFMNRLIQLLEDPDLLMMEAM